MATGTDQLSQDALASLGESRRTLGFGLLWGGVMLTLLAFWLGVKPYDIPPVILGVVGVLALAGVALGLGQLRGRARGVGLVWAGLLLGAVALGLAGLYRQYGE